MPHKSRLFDGQTRLQLIPWVKSTWAATMECRAPFLLASAPIWLSFDQCQNHWPACS